MNDEEFNNWGRAFKEIHNRSPKKDDYDIAPVSIQEYFHKKDAERRALLKRKQPLECKMIVPNGDIINKPSIYSIVKRNRKTPGRFKKECGSKEVEKNVIERDKINDINTTPKKSILESPLKGWRMPSNFKNNILKTPTSEVKKRKVNGDSQAVTSSSPTKVILSKKSTGEIRKNLFHALKKLGSE